MDRKKGIMNGTRCHESFGLRNKYTMGLNNYAIVLRHGVEKGRATGIHKERKNNGKNNIA